MKEANNHGTGNWRTGGGERSGRSLLDMETIPYVEGGRTTAGMDCQGLVRWVLEELGVKHIKGSNNQWRNMTSDKGTIEEGVEKYGEIRWVR